MDAVRFVFFLTNGSQVTGPVQGSGGLVGAGYTTTLTRSLALTRIREAMADAHRGRRTGLYEPKRGFVVVYPDYSAQGNGPERLLDLRQVESIGLVKIASPAK